MVISPYIAKTEDECSLMGKLRENSITDDQEAAQPSRKDWAIRGK
jgi:hypothetical protein